MSLADREKRATSDPDIKAVNTISTIMTMDSMICELVLKGEKSKVLSIVWYVESGSNA